MKTSLKQAESGPLVAILKEKELAHVRKRYAEIQAKRGEPHSFNGPKRKVKP